jgi:hypothetical protein
MPLQKSFLTLGLVGLLFVTSCSRQERVSQVHQSTTITIPDNKIVVVDIHDLKGFHEHSVGLECSPSVWNSLTNGLQPIAVSLKSVGTNSSELLTVNPGRSGTVCDQVPDTHYLFGLSIQGNAKIQMIFPNPPADNTPIKLVVFKATDETGN